MDYKIKLDTMEKIEGLETKYKCQKIKDSINEKNGLFVEFVARCLDDEGFVKAMNELLPFDNVAQAKLKRVDDVFPVKSIGLSIMRMELELPLFSLGVSIEIAGSDVNKAVNSTTFISACRTIEELKEYVKSDTFSMLVKENFEKLVEDGFSSQNEGS